MAEIDIHEEMAKVVAQLTAAVTPADLHKFGVSWSLKLTNEGGYIFALIVGLIIANFLPRFAETIKEAIRPEDVQLARDWRPGTIKEGNIKRAGTEAGFTK